MISFPFPLPTVPYLFLLLVLRVLVLLFLRDLVVRLALSVSFQSSYFVMVAYLLLDLLDLVRLFHLTVSLIWNLT